MRPQIEIRCQIYGFIQLSDWEREIISQPAFQRLRRIRQLPWTDYVYQGAMHTRFEHSLGVMHRATLLYDAIVARSWPELEDILEYNQAGKERNLIPWFTGTGNFFVRTGNVALETGNLLRPLRFRAPASASTSPGQVACPG